MAARKLTARAINFAHDTKKPLASHLLIPPPLANGRSTALEGGRAEFGILQLQRKRQLIISLCVPRDIIFAPQTFIAELVIVVCLFQVRLRLGIRLFIGPNAFVLFVPRAVCLPLHVRRRLEPPMGRGPDLRCKFLALWPCLHVGQSE